MSVLYRYHSECKTYWSNTCVCCHFPKGKRDCKASYVLQTRCCLGGLDSMSSFAVLYSPPGLWRLVFNLTVFVFITFTLSYASYPEKQSENLPRLLHSPLLSTDYRLSPPRLLLVITPVASVFPLISDSLTYSHDSLLFLCCCIPDWKLCATIFISPYHCLCYFIL